MVLTFAALLLALSPATVGHAQSASAEAAPRKGEMYTVTLITGDRVDVYIRGERITPQVRPGKGRGQISFAVSRVQGHVYVMPSDALALVGRGQLDRRLFDVAALVKHGYHDAKRVDVPLLVQGGSADGVAPLADDGGGTVTRRLAAADAVAVSQPKRSAIAFWSAVRRGDDLRTGVKRVWLDGKRKALLDRSVPQVGAPNAWEAGYTGEGVTVAVLDTGIDATHPDFGGRIGGSKDFSGTGTVNDTVGHGTHVASTIAGSGAASGGKYKGVAPDATLLIGKVCGDVWCTESAILAGMQWAAESGAAVANLSLGGRDTPEVDPLEAAVNELTARYGTLFVIAAGNGGDHESISSPGSADAALTVGAVDRDDELARFSSRGPRVGDAALKPEITAPGVNIVAANAKDGFLGEPGQEYTALSGTSMATPHVAGAAAILAQRHGDWKADKLKAALVGSAKTRPGLGAYAQGAGRLDVARAVGHDGYAAPAAVSAGLVEWPHDNKEPVTDTVTYHNPGSQPVTYDLTVSTLGPDGEPGPEGMFTLSADTATVPAGGTATVDVTVDTAVDSLHGYHSAWITATAGDAVVTTPVAVNKEVESYQLTVTATDRTGAVPQQYLVVLINIDTGRFRVLYEADGSTTVRVPKGRYHTFAFIDTGETATSLITYPVYEVTADRALTLDARDAKPVSITFDRADVEFAIGMVDYTHRWDNGGIGAGVITSDLAQVSTLHLGPDLGRDEMLSTVSGLWGVPDANGNFGRTPRAYHLAYNEYGRLMTGFSKRVAERDLAAVKATYRSQHKDQYGTKFWFASTPGWGGGGGAAFVTPLPHTRTEYHNVGGGVEWQADLWLGSGRNFEGQLVGDPVEHRAGRTYRENWNAAVFGPGISGTVGEVSRLGDRISVRVPMYSDSAGHAGSSATDTANTTLYRDREQVGESDEPGYGTFQVPAEAGDYRLTVDATRTVSAFSTRVSCEWTFRSRHAEDRQVLPLTTVGFAPELDLHNRAEAGIPQQVPVTVRAAGGAGKVEMKSLTVEVSYDDGGTWTEVLVTPWHVDDTWLAHIAHPSGRKYVSLRTSAVDTDGNSVKQTLIRAYGLK